VSQPSATEESLTDHPIEIGPVARAVVERFAERADYEGLRAGGVHAISQMMTHAVAMANVMKNSSGHTGLTDS
jgi:hypothetical protein